MRILTGRGGEPAACFGPVLDIATLAGLESLCPLDAATVADRDGGTLDQLTAAAVSFLQRTGWTDDAELIAELAADMADMATQVAADYPVGARLRAQFDRDTDEWTFTPVSA